ncbi:uncharacterized protein LOC120270500 [Dioscorea cayenensis subsp. rotundata]|uniref:Uncharacterized protein LOC120270500 n=1 Tax=Dioscorea cayennensis subsp. rotundata TaxID=55577 RepID=A0AB40C2T1_DIOCR|nr:uncharacterized protein LOC120270500 [Dioscorea cayenensis subsp. rotundata]
MRIERVSSIELEPRTLTLDQLQYAREAALYILSTKSLEEAVGIFTEGLEPVLSLTEKGMMHEETDEINHLSSDNMMTSSLAEETRDIASAPF